MQELKVIGVEEGALLVASDEGARFRVAVDDVLQSRLRQSSPELGASRKLSPREIQTHIRAGMSAEDVVRGHRRPARLRAALRGPGARRARVRHRVGSQRSRAHRDGDRPALGRRDVRRRAAPSTGRCRGDQRALGQLEGGGRLVDREAHLRRPSRSTTTPAGPSTPRSRRSPRSTRRPSRSRSRASCRRTWSRACAPWRSTTTRRRPLRQRRLHGRRMTAARPALCSNPSSTAASAPTRSTRPPPRKPTQPDRRPARGAASPSRRARPDGPRARRADRRAPVDRCREADRRAARHRAGETPVGSARHAVGRLDRHRAAGRSPAAARKNRTSMPSWDEIVFGARTDED